MQRDKLALNAAFIRSWLVACGKQAPDVQTRPSLASLICLQGKSGLLEDDDGLDAYLASNKRPRTEGKQGTMCIVYVIYGQRCAQLACSLASHR